MRMEEDFAGRQNIGKRQRQEDFYTFCSLRYSGEDVESLMLVLADGMGGHASGNIASELAGTAFLQQMAGLRHEEDIPIREKLEISLHQANAAIAGKVATDPDNFQGMGTTLLALHVDGYALSWVSVGDSPLFLCRAKSIYQLNEDHSGKPHILEMLQNGEITLEDAQYHPYSNLLLSALNGEEIAKIDNPPYPLALESGDVIIAASDGILTLDASEILEAILANPGKPACDLANILEHKVLEHEVFKQDNCTIAVIRVP